MRIRKYSLIFLVFFLSFFMFGSAHAADVAKIGILNMQRVLSASDPGKAAQAETPERHMPIFALLSAIPCQFPRAPHAPRTPARTTRHADGNRAFNISPLVSRWEGLRKAHTVHAAHRHAMPCTPAKDTP